MRLGNKLLFFRKHNIYKIEVLFNKNVKKKELF